MTKNNDITLQLYKALGGLLGSLEVPRWTNNAATIAQAHNAIKEAIMAIEKVEKNFGHKPTPTQALQDILIATEPFFEEDTPEFMIKKVRKIATCVLEDK